MPRAGGGVKRGPMLAVVVGFLLLWAGAALLLDRAGRAAPPDPPWDAIVVAGCRVNPDGRPSLALQRRARLGVDLWRQGLAPRVVFTGGVGQHAPSEARAAADYAAALGLPPEAAVLEERSTSTEENARYAEEVLAERGLPAERVLLVTDGYHTFRAARVFGRYFPEVRAVGSQATRSVRVRGALREVLAIGWYALAGKL